MITPQPEQYSFKGSRTERQIILNCLLNAETFFDDDFFENAVGRPKSEVGPLHSRLQWIGSDGARVDDS